MNKEEDTLYPEWLTGKKSLLGGFSKARRTVKVIVFSGTFVPPRISNNGFYFM